MTPCDHVPLGLFKGQGVFTTFLVNPPHPIFALSAHYQRLVEACTFFNLHFPWHAFEAFESLLNGFIHGHITSPLILRIMLIPTTAISLEETTQVVFLPRPYQPRVSPRRVCTVSFDRYFPQHKHLSMLADTVYLEQAKARGFDDYLRISSQGHLTECAHDNFFLIDSHQAVLTPAVHPSGCLPGIMRAHVIEMCRQKDIAVSEGCFSPQDLAMALGAFSTNAVHGLTPITQIDTLSFNTTRTAPLLRALSDPLVHR